MATQAQQLSDFISSYERCDAYPTNLIYKASYKGVLKNYEARVATADPPFLTQIPTEVKVYFRDWDAIHNKFVDHGITNEERLRQHLGEQSHMDQRTGAEIWRLLPQKDPKCRFVFLNSDRSTRPLRITPCMLKRLLSYHQVMAPFIDFLSVFGQPPEKHELGFSGFYDQTTLSSRNVGSQTTNTQQISANTSQHITTPIFLSRGPAVARLSRSGRQYQLCYNLKRVIRKYGTARDAFSAQKWSIQQNQFHHQFDIVEGTALWINAKGGLKDYMDEVMDLTGGAAGQPGDISVENGEDCFKATLTVHLMNSQWASNDWRGYVRFLEDAIEEQTRNILGSQWASNENTPDSLQEVQHLEEKATKAHMILGTNIENMTALRNFYMKLSSNRDFDIKDQCAEAMVIFEHQMDDMIHAFAGHQRRTKLLISITENRKNLLLQKMQSHATKKMEDLTTMSYREAIVMKVITAGTFVFLPATFVSTFFSTDVVKYQNTPDGKGSFSKVALMSWLEVTIPLTLLTLLLGIIAFVVADRRRKTRLPSSFDEKGA